MKKWLINYPLQKKKKFLTLYKEQLDKLYFKAKKLFANFYDSYHLKKLYIRSIIFILSLVLVFINSNQVYANDYLLENILNEKQIIVLGSNEEISKTLKDINKYLALNPEIKKNNFQKSENGKFILKPLVLETKSRQQIEQEKQQQESQVSVQNYLNYSNYNTYSRNTIPRENTNIRNPNSYYYGYCTWYVASKKDVPSFWGNAGNWLGSAQTNGYKTSNEAEDDAIIVTNESGWGHVGIVEEVNEDTVTISEMNYNGWGTVNTREIPKDSPIIKGFIHEPRKP